MWEELHRDNLSKVMPMPSFHEVDFSTTSWRALCRVEHLYQHVFPPHLAPSISFVGLPWKVVPFAQYELQAQWIARVLSGRVRLPSRQDMHAHIQALYKELELKNVPKRCAALCMVTSCRRNAAHLACQRPPSLTEALGNETPSLRCASAAVQPCCALLRRQTMSMVGLQVHAHAG